MRFSSDSIRRLRSPAEEFWVNFRLPVLRSHTYDLNKRRVADCGMRNVPGDEVATLDLFHSAILIPHSAFHDTAPVLGRGGATTHTLIGASPWANPPVLLPAERRQSQEGPGAAPTPRLRARHEYVRKTPLVLSLQGRPLLRAETFSLRALFGRETEVRH